MSPGPEQRDLLLVHAAVDGELDPANAAALEERIAADPGLAEERARVEALRQAWRERLPPEPAPPGLRERVRRAVGLAAAPPRFSSQPSWRALAASVALAAMLSSGGTWYALRTPPTGDAIAEAVLARHLRGLMAPPPIHVASSDRPTVKPSFNRPAPPQGPALFQRPRAALAARHRSCGGGLPPRRRAHRCGRPQRRSAAGLSPPRARHQPPRHCGREPRPGDRHPAHDQGLQRGRLG